MNDDWKPIETAPKDGTYILLYGKPSRRVIGSWDDTDKKWLTCLQFQWEPTLWMPLPPMPA